MTGCSSEWRIPPSYTSSLSADNSRHLGLTSLRHINATELDTVSPQYQGECSHEMHFSIKDVDFVSLDQTALLGRIQISRNKIVQKENKRSGGGLPLPAELLDWPGPELQVDKFIPLWASVQRVMIDACSRTCQQSSRHYHLRHEMTEGLIWSPNNHHSEHKIISIVKWVGKQNDFHVARACLTFTGGCSVSNMW